MYRYNRLPDSVGLRDIPEAIVRSRIGLERTLASRMCELFGFAGFISMGNGRQALHFALSRTSESRKEVIVPAYGCPIVSRTVCAAGKTPVFVDIHPLTFSPTADAVAAAVGKETAAVIVVHEYGKAVAQDVLDAARRHEGVLVVEDAAIAMGARRADGTRIGAAGDYTVFSGGLGKPISAASWGGLGAKSEGDIPAPGGAFQTRGWISSLTRIAALTALRQPVVYDLLKGILDQLVTADTEAVDTSWSSPSWLDSALIAGKVDTLDQIAGRMDSLAREARRIIMQHELACLDIGKDVVTPSRFPFYLSSESAATEIVALAKREGLELVRPYCRAFWEGDAKRFPNAAAAVARVVAVPLKMRGHQIMAERLERILRKARAMGLLEV